MPDQHTSNHQDNSLEEVLKELESRFGINQEENNKSSSTKQKKAINFANGITKKTLGGLTLLLLVVGVAAGVYLGQRNQNLQQHAQTPPDYYTCNSDYKVLTYSLTVPGFGTDWEDFVPLQYSSVMTGIPGITFTHSKRATDPVITSALLNQYDALFLFNGCGPNNLLSASEVDAIRQFVQSGRSLILVGDDSGGNPPSVPGPCNGGINQVLSGYNADMSSGLVYDSSCQPVTVSGPLGEGIASMNLGATPAVLTVNGPATWVNGTLTPFINGPAAPNVYPQGAWIDGVNQPFGTTIVIPHFSFCRYSKIFRYDVGLSQVIVSFISKCGMTIVVPNG
jgi:hypothetical protein